MDRLFWFAAMILGITEQSRKNCICISSSPEMILWKSSVQMCDWESISLQYSIRMVFLSRSWGHWGRRRWGRSSRSWPHSSQLPLWPRLKWRRREPTLYFPLNILSWMIILLTSYECPAVDRMKWVGVKERHELRLDVLQGWQRSAPSPQMPLPEVCNLILAQSLRGCSFIT